MTRHLLTSFAPEDSMPTACTRTMAAAAMALACSHEVLVGKTAFSYTATK